MRIGITGVPGWLTTALLGRLSDEPPADDFRVTTFVHPSHRTAVEGLRAAYPFIDRVVDLDLAQPAFPPDAFSGIDRFVHTAAIIHVTHPSEWMTVNHTGTVAIAEAARGAGVKRFVFLSSNAAGGRNTSPTHVMTEADAPKPMSLYGESKLHSERKLRALETSGTFDVAILRPSMFYGPPVPERHLDIYRRILTGAMPMVGDGHYRRSITYIDSLVQATMLALMHPNASGQTYYVVDEPIYTTRSIVDAMATALGAKARYIPVPAFVAPMAYTADRLLARAGRYVAPIHLLGEADWDVAISCEKAKRELGYKPIVELRDGMQRAIDWCKERNLLPASR